MRKFIITLIILWVIGAIFVTEPAAGIIIAILAVIIWSFVDPKNPVFKQKGWYDQEHR